VRAIVAGEILAAFLGQSDVPLEDSAHFIRTFAGAESNTAIGLSRQGVTTALLGRVGADALGRAAIRHLRAENVNVSFVRTDPSAPTGILIRNVAETGIEVIYGRRGSAGSRLQATDVPHEAFADLDLLHLSGITPMLSNTAAEAARLACRLAAKAGAAISFDPNLRLRMGPLERWRATVQPYLECADVLLTGADEAVALTGAASTDEAIARLHELGGALVVVKDGAKGARASDGAAWFSAPAIPVRVVDPVGAGDAFNAGFLAIWLTDRDTQQALENGARLGAMSVAARGDTAGIADIALGAPIGAAVLR